ncbi:MAG: hypothetical protein AAFQ75_07920, partial [Pseudomonadota bacterium]
MPATPREYAWMALDAYDNSLTPNDPDSTVIADPAVEVEFPEWRVLPPEGEKAEDRNATRTDMSGFEANVYVNDTTQQIVIAFRGTEFGYFVDAVSEGDFDLIDEANLDKDVESLFGYYQDEGRTLKGIENEAGGFAEALEDRFGFSSVEAQVSVGKEKDIFSTGWGGTGLELDAIRRGELDATPMRMGDDVGAATAEA